MRRLTGSVGGNEETSGSCTGSLVLGTFRRVNEKINRICGSKPGNKWRLYLTLFKLETLYSLGSMIKWDLWQSTSGDDKE